MTQRVIAYIDGFNLYYGLKDANLRHGYWLDIPRLVRRYLLPDHELIQTKYFTSRVAGDPEKQHRQNVYLEALLSLPGVTPYFGQYLLQDRKCRTCTATWKVPNEKMTDVNIAVQMLCDAFENRFDIAFLVSADSDLQGPLEAIRRTAPLKRLWVGFPPHRGSVVLRRLAHEQRKLQPVVIEQCQMPDDVMGLDGVVRRRPAAWARPPAPPNP